MRTTIRLPDDLLADAKRAALESQRTLTAVIEDALRESLARRDGQVEHASPVRLTTYGERGTLPGVNLDDAAELLEVMEGGGDPGRC